MNVQHPTLNAQRSRGLNRLTLTLWGARLGCTVRTLWQLEGRWCRGRCFDKLSMTDRGGGHGAAGWDSRPYQRQDAADEGASKTCILRNEPICNVEENAFIWLGENELCRLQKNDKWLRFPGNEAPERTRIPLTRTLCRIRQRRLVGLGSPRSGEEIAERTRSDSNLAGECKSEL